MLRRNRSPATCTATRPSCGSSRDTEHLADTVAHDPPQGLPKPSYTPVHEADPRSPYALADSLALGAVFVSVVFFVVRSQDDQPPGTARTEGLYRRHTGSMLFGNQPLVAGQRYVVWCSTSEPTAVFFAAVIEAT